VQYRDSVSLPLARQINDFVRSKTSDPTTASAALSAALASCSFVPIGTDGEELRSCSVADLTPSATQSKLNPGVYEDPQQP
jgi:hypothetical protein